MLAILGFSLRYPPPRPLVLIVEGHEENRAMYAITLSASGFDVVAVKDGGEAWGRALQIQPDIIVADLSMPHHGGRQFLENLKQNPRTRDIPIVAKPSLPDELAAVLRRVLDRHVHVRS